MFRLRFKDLKYWVFAGVVATCSLSSFSMPFPRQDEKIQLPISMDSLIAYYPLNGNAKDYSGHGHHGEIFGAKPTTDRSGKADQALKFDGLDDYIDLGNSKNFKPNFPITVAVWFVSNRPYNQNIFTNNFDENYYNGIWFGLDNSGKSYPKIEYGNGGYTTKFGRKTFFGNKEINLEVWHHLVAIYLSVDTLACYVDGKFLLGSYKGFASQLTYSEGPAEIGRKDGNYDAPPWYFEGVIDDLFFFNRILTREEIKALYQFLDH